MLPPSALFTLPPRSPSTTVQYPWPGSIAHTDRRLSAINSYFCPRRFGSSLLFYCLLLSRTLDVFLFHSSAILSDTTTPRIDRPVKSTSGSTTWTSVAWTALEECFHVNDSELLPAGPCTRCHGDERDYLPVDSIIILLLHTWLKVTLLRHITTNWWDWRAIWNNTDNNVIFRRWFIFKVL